MYLISIILIYFSYKFLIIKYSIFFSIFLLKIKKNFQKEKKNLYIFAANEASCYFYSEAFKIFILILKKKRFYLF